MNKRVISMMLAVTMLLAVLTGCGENPHLTENWVGHSGNESSVGASGTTMGVTEEDFPDAAWGNFEWEDTAEGRRITGLTAMGKGQGVLTIPADAISVGGLADNKEVVAVRFEGADTFIEAEAFARNTSLEDVILPSSLAILETSVFTDCTSLKGVQFPSNGTLKRIMVATFKNCTALTEVEIPEGVTEIWPDAFYGCKSLKTVKFPDGLREIESYAFAHCESLESVEFPDSLYMLASGSFSECLSLESVTIPGGVRDVGIAAFSECSRLRTVRILEGVEEVSGMAFDWCPSLEEMYFPGSLECFEDDEMYETAPSKVYVRAGSYMESRIDEILKPGTYEKIYQ